MSDKLKQYVREERTKLVNECDKIDKKKNLFMKGVIISGGFAMFALLNDILRAKTTHIYYGEMLEDITMVKSVTDKYCNILGDSGISYENRENKDSKCLLKTICNETVTFTLTKRSNLDNTSYLGEEKINNYSSLYRYGIKAGDFVQLKSHYKRDNFTGCLTNEKVMDTIKLYDKNAKFETRCDLFLNKVKGNRILQVGALSAGVCYLFYKVIRK